MEVVGSAAYEPEFWASFAIAEVGAAAALAGLLVVSASINIARIIAIPTVVSRLAATLLLFAGVLFVGTVILVPGQSRTAVGIEIAIIGAALAVSVWFERGVEHAEPAYRRPALIAAIAGLVAAVLIAFAGVATAGMTAGGLYWLVPGILLALGVGLLNAWVALIEILR